jgi:mycoredoxin
VTTETTPQALDVYWRPGCMFCASLKRSLKRRKVPVRLHNIWEDPDAAATVRAAADGNETVPTVAIGGEVLVNPTPQAVEALIGRVAPDLLPPRPDGTVRKRFWSRR